METLKRSPDQPYFNDGDRSSENEGSSQHNISRCQFNQTVFEELADRLKHDPKLAYVPTRITYDTKTEPDGIIVTDLRTENDAN